MYSESMKSFLPEDSFNVYNKAEVWCCDIIQNAAGHISSYLQQRNLLEIPICFAVVGSVGRYEGFGASDIDLIPIAKDQEALNKFQNYDSDLREILRNKLSIPVSRGLEFTKLTNVEDLITETKIGGVGDNTIDLTKRILLLTEGRQIYGNYKLSEIKHQILDSYNNKRTTSGKYLLSFCNDLARYYRTLCIEYKGKIDAEGKDWCIRNLKLRCTRKFWYFSNLISIVHLAYKENESGTQYADELLKLLEFPPYIRLYNSINNNQMSNARELFRYYSWYLNYMSNISIREHLTGVIHSNRYELDQNNPFPFMKTLSDMIHHIIISLYETMEPQKKENILNWFLF